MANVLIFHHFLKVGERSVLASGSNPEHKYECTGARWVHPDPFRQGKHMGLSDLLKQMLMSIDIAAAGKKYDCLIIDTQATALFVGIFLMPFRTPHVIVSNFNVFKKRDNPFFNFLCSLAFRRIDRLIVHSPHDRALIAQLYKIPKHRIIFQRYARLRPKIQKLPESHQHLLEKPYVLSMGANARDYRTLFEAAANLSLRLVVVAREWNLAGLSIPNGTETYTNVPLEICDALLAKCHFCVYTFDGSEPSCGQISVVSALMFGKPVVCTDLPGLDGYVENGVNGFRTPLRDVSKLQNALQALSENTELHRRMTDGAIAWAKRFADVDEIQKDFDDIVDGVQKVSSDLRDIREPQ